MTLSKQIGCVLPLLFSNAFLASARVAISIPDPSPYPFSFIGAGDASVTYSGVVFSTSAALATDAVLFDVGPYYGADPAVLASELQSSSTGIANLLITLPFYTTTLSLDFGTTTGSPVTFLLSNADSFIQSSTASTYTAPNTFSVTDTAFNSILLTTGDPNGLAINNISFEDSTTATPEPKHLGLLTAGCALLTLVFGCLKKVGLYAKERQDLAHHRL